ncbi:rhodanese domain protein [Phyllosticta capitalensis]
MATVATTRAATAAAALTRLPAAALSRSSRAAATAVAGQRSFSVASGAGRRVTTSLRPATSTHLWRHSGIGASRRWKSGWGEKEKGWEKEKELLGFDEVSAIVKNATPSRAYLTNQSLPLLIDVRSPAEYAAGAIPCAVNLPVNSAMDTLFASPEDFEDKLGFPRPDAKRPLVFYCKAGVRSRAAAELAKQAGFEDVREYPGSWLDWEGRGGEVVKGQDLVGEE